MKKETIEKILINKIESQRAMFLSSNKRYYDDKKAKSLLSNNKLNNKKNISQQNSAKRKGHSAQKCNNKRKNKNLSR